LINHERFERVVLFYQPAFERLGIKASVRLVDKMQYVNRLRDWHFDIIVAIWGETLTPGSEQWNYWGSLAADLPGSRNLIAIKNPAVDALINSIVFAPRAKRSIVCYCGTTTWCRTGISARCAPPAGTVSITPAHAKYGQAAFPTLWRDPRPS
jgi:hypothetical protein